MRNYQIALVLCMGLSLMGFSRKKPAPAPEPSPSVSVAAPSPVDGEIDILASISGGTKEQRDRLSRLVVESQHIINSEEFKSQVLGATFKDGSKKWSGASVWSAIVGGSELKSVANGQWDMQLEIAVHCNAHTCDNLGWTYANSKTIYFNNRGYKKSYASKFDTRTDSGLVGTLCHEQMHKLGYGHSSASAEQSVPYSVGTICAEIYSELFK